MTTKADLARFRKLQKIGCLACRQRGLLSQSDVHHLLTGGRRRGHQFTVPLCPWHHKGEPPDRWTAAESRRFYGPSLAKESRQFRAEFGDDETLLATVDRLLEKVT